MSHLPTIWPRYLWPSPGVAASIHFFIISCMLGAALASPFAGSCAPALLCKAAQIITVAQSTILNLMASLLSPGSARLLACGVGLLFVGTEELLRGGGHLFGRHIADVRREVPLVAIRVADDADAVAPEGLFHRTDDGRPGAHGAVERFVAILDVEIERAAVAVERFGRVRAPLRKLVTDEQGAVANLHLAMDDLAAVGRRVAADFFRAERLLVKVHCLRRSSDEDRRRDGVKTAGNLLHFRHG